MSSVTLDELVSDAQRLFQASLGPDFGVQLREVVGESHYRGGFRLVFSRVSSEVAVSYGDLELEVSGNGLELFGAALHEGFEGNMFSRENLKKCLPRIAASSIAQLQAAG